MRRNEQNEGKGKEITQRVVRCKLNFSVFIRFTNYIRLLLPQFANEFTRFATREVCWRRSFTSLLVAELAVTNRFVPILLSFNTLTMINNV